MEKEDIAQFYDDFSDKQLKTGINERLISLYKRMRSRGLKRDSKVLELGCGVGHFTYLLSQKVKRGKVEAVDLSEVSIQKAQQHMAGTNVEFFVADVVAYNPQYADFDFITLMDVIEHIPIEQHSVLFQNIARICTEKTQLLINIPNPEYLNFARQHTPETLQVVDQEILLLPLLGILEKVGLELVFFEKYSIWEVEDYHFFAIRKKRRFELQHLADQRTVAGKISHQISKKINALKYR